MDEFERDAAVVEFGGEAPVAATQVSAGAGREAIHSEHVLDVALA